MDSYLESRRDLRLMAAAVVKLVPGRRYWLDRHVRGWGEVEFLRATESGLAWVRDCSDNGEYPADPRHLRAFKPLKVK